VRQSGVISTLALSGIAGQSYHTEMRSHRCAAHGRNGTGLRSRLDRCSFALAGAVGARVEGPASHRVKLPAGASGPSTTSASERVPSGTPDHIESPRPRLVAPVGAEV
jgi:hypothetical protein